MLSFFRIYFEGGVPKMYANQLTNGVHFFWQFYRLRLQLYQKHAPLQVKRLLFLRFLPRFVVFYRGFSKFYKLAFLRKPFSRGCWPLQGSQNIDFHKSCSIYIYMATDYGLGKPKILSVLNGNLIVLKLQNTRAISKLKWQV